MGYEFVPHSASSVLPVSGRAGMHVRACTCEPARVCACTRALPRLRITPRQRALARGPASVCVRVCTPLPRLTKAIELGASSALRQQMRVKTDPVNLDLYCVYTKKRFDFSNQFFLLRMTAGSFGENSRSVSLYWCVRNYFS